MTRQRTHRQHQMLQARRRASFLKTQDEAQSSVDEPTQKTPLKTKETAKENTPC